MRKAVGGEVGVVGGSQFPQYPAGISRPKVPLGDVGSFGRVLSSGLWCCIGEEAEEHKNHPVSHASGSGRLRMGSQATFYQVALPLGS